VHGELTVDKMLEELKLQEATYKSLDVELPDKMSLTTEQMNFIKKENPALLGELAAVFDEVTVSDVPLDGHCTMNTK
jgi:hypothetical protein